MTRPLDPAETLVLVTVATLAIGDALLYHQRQRLVTDVLRTRLGLAGLTVLTAHALDVLGPLDPFRALGRLIPRSR